MPLYEYECESGHRFELIQKFADGPVESCPNCRRPVHRLISSPAFHFKGTGWYITDYARKAAPSDGAKDEAKDGGKDGAKDAGKDAGKGESAASTSGAKADTGSTDKSSPSGHTASSGSTTSTPSSSASKDS